MAWDQDSSAAPEAAPPPAIGACYGNGWRQLRRYFLELLLISIVYFVIYIPQGLLSSAGEHLGSAGSFFELVSLVYLILVAWPAGYGVAYAFLKAARGQQPAVRDILAVVPSFWSAVLANLLTTVLIVVGFVLLIVPGIILACRLPFVPYLVVERQLSAVEAVKTSWRLTSGHALTVLGAALLGIPIGLLGLVLLVVGVIPAYMWISLAFASLYFAISTTAGGDDTVVTEPAL